MSEMKKYQVQRVRVEKQTVTEECDGKPVNLPQWMAQFVGDEADGPNAYVNDEGDDVLIGGSSFAYSVVLSPRDCVLLHAALSSYINDPRPDPWAELLGAFPFGEDGEINGADVVDFINARLG